MKLLHAALLFLVSLFFCSATAFCQSITCIAPGVVIVDTVQASLVLSESSSSSRFLFADADNRLSWEHIVTRPAPGEIEFHIPVDSIRFSGDGSAADSLSTQDLFALIAQTTILDAISLGYISCSGTCPGITVRVYLPSCVQRSGSGSSTSFTSCSSSQCCVREYQVCCPAPNGSPVLTPVQSQTPSCLSSAAIGCESACP